MKVGKIALCARFFVPISPLVFVYFDVRARRLEIEARKRASTCYAGFPSVLHAAGESDRWKIGALLVLIHRDLKLKT